MEDDVSIALEAAVVWRVKWSQRSSCCLKGWWWLSQEFHKYFPFHSIGFKLEECSVARVDGCVPNEIWAFGTHLTTLNPSRSPPVWMRVPSGLNCPEEHHVSVRIVRGRTVLVAGSNSTECAVQSCCSVRSLGSFLHAPSETWPPAVVSCHQSGWVLLLLLNFISRFVNAQSMSKTSMKGQERNLICFSTNLVIKWDYYA
jgi:hypothetical protein